MTDNPNKGRIKTTVSRRRLLQAIGGMIAYRGFSTAADARENKKTIRVNVGYASKRGKKAAENAASKVIHDFSFDAITIKASQKAVDGLRKRGDVRYVEEDGKAQALGQSLPWGIDRVDADRAHAAGDTGDGADIAILDTGIDPDHEDLQANIGEGLAVYTCDDCTEPWGDNNGHGTHCAGIAAAVDNDSGVVGVAPGATLHAVKVLGADGWGYWSDIAYGIEWVADQGYDVGSMSLGGDTGSSTLKEACSYAYNNGVLLVAAAGNSGPCSDCVMYPARYSECVAVTATDSSDSLADFSSTGSEVELAAPGESIYSTVPGGGYQSWSGTSMAGPHVAGAGGQVMAQAYTNDEARQRLQETAEDISLSTNESGHGLLDVEAAVDSSTGDTAVVVSTDGASDVTTTSAVLSGTLEDLGGASSADVYFEYRQTGADTWETTAVQTLTTTDSFSSEVTGLSSGSEHEFRAVAVASDGDKSTGSAVTFTTGSGGDNPPAVDRYSVSEKGSPNPHAQITASWAVSDGDGDLSTVTVDVMDSSGRVVESTETAVSGGSASGSDSFTIKKVRGQTFDVVLTVSDSNGNTATASRSVTE